MSPCFYRSYINIRSSLTLLPMTFTPLFFSLFSTVDGFQGREKDIIIMSTVRSGGGGGIGFLSDARRMNVALTRGRHSMIVVCNAETLCQDDDWRALVAHAVRKGSLVHTDFVSEGRLPSSYSAVLLNAVGDAVVRPVNAPVTAAVPDTAVGASRHKQNLRGLCPKVAKILEKRTAMCWTKLQEVAAITGPEAGEDGDVVMAPAAKSEHKHKHKSDKKEHKSEKKEHKHKHDKKEKRRDDAGAAAGPSSGAK